MLYMLYGRDVPNSAPLRAAARPAHLERVQELADEGRVLLAGPLPAVDSEDPGPAGMAGSLLVIEFESLEAARRWFENDPYVAAGVFSQLEVRPFKQVFPA